MAMTRLMGIVALGAVIALAPTGAEARLTTPACLAKKLKEWGKLRNCQANENAKALKGKPSDLPKCQTKFANKLAKLNDQATRAAIACRYGVNTGAEAGTVTDYDTGLQWEQKTDDGSIHDKDNLYQWSTGSPWAPTGQAFWYFLWALNVDLVAPGGDASTGCFAGHCDWRLPSKGELGGTIDRTQGYCAGPPSLDPCIDQTVFGPAPAEALYVSASTDSSDNSLVWVIDFVGGYLGGGYKDAVGFNVRGVRSAL